MNPENPFGLSDETRRRVEEILERQHARIGRYASALDMPTQVLFYDRGAFDFAFAWQAVAPADRWLFQVSTEAPGFLYYVCLRLQQLGHQPGQILIAASGQGALFYTTVASASPNSSGVVGLLPDNTPPHDFGSTINSFAPDATLTLVTSSTAGDQTFEGTEYKGTDLVGPLAIYTNGKVVATDQAVVWSADGTASTTGNIWVGDPQSGEATILCPAPAGGASQNFPLGTNPVCG